MFEVIATGGDSALGGDDYDAALADWVLQSSHEAQRLRIARRQGRRRAKRRRARLQAVDDY